MNHLRSSNDASVQSFDGASDNEPSSIAFTSSAARLNQRSPRLAIASALAVGILGCLVLLRGGGPGAGAVAAGNELESFRLECERGDAIACNNLGVSYEHGFAVTPDPESAFRAFERACRGGSPDGCGNLGALYERGEGTAVNLSEALRMYEQSCNAGAALGCSNLGALYARGKGVARDAAEARRLFSLACDTGSAAGCSNLMASGSR